MNEGVDTIVLYNELAYHDVLPVVWRSREQPLSRFELTGLEESNLVLLQACVAMQEQPARDHGEDAGPLANELARLDFKLNLVLQLLGKLVLRDRMPAATSVRFNAHGASWTAIGPVPGTGERGVLRIHLHESLPQPLELAARDQCRGGLAGAGSLSGPPGRSRGAHPEIGVPLPPARRSRCAQIASGPVPLERTPAVAGISLAPVHASR